MTAAVPFIDVARDVSAGNAKLPQTKFLKAGRIPVVDQGQSFIAGYTDDEGYLFRQSLGPVIVFGDHTRAVKFVDFPFAMGADGIKVLKPCDGCDPKYLFHYLRQAPIPNAGYSRHFKFLRELKVPLPSVEKQRLIAETLDKADELRIKRRAVIAKLDKLLQSYFVEMFGDGIANDRNLPVVPLSEAVDAGRPITYGILKPGPDMPEGVPYVRVVDIKKGSIASKLVKRTSPEIAAAYKRSELRSGDLLMSIRGHVGRLAIVPAELNMANITQDTARISLSSSFEPEYVSGFLGSDAVQRYMRRFVRGAAVQGINLKDVRELPLLVPCRDEQKRYASVAASISKLQRTNEEYLTAAETMFRALQQRYFEG